jgi:hypothetical protein
MYWSRMIHHLNIRGHLGSLNEFDHFRPSGHPRTWPHGRISPSGRLRARMRVVILACGKAGGLDLPIADSSPGRLFPSLGMTWRHQHFYSHPSRTIHHWRAKVTGDYDLSSRSDAGHQSRKLARTLKQDQGWQLRIVKHPLRGSQIGWRKR